MHLRVGKHPRKHILDEACKFHVQPVQGRAMTNPRTSFSPSRLWTQTFLNFIRSAVQCMSPCTQRTLHGLDALMGLGDHLGPSPQHVSSIGLILNIMTGHTIMKYSAQDTSLCTIIEYYRRHLWLDRSAVTFQSLVFDFRVLMNRVGKGGRNGRGGEQMWSMNVVFKVLWCFR